MTDDRGYDWDNRWGVGFGLSQKAGYYNYSYGSLCLIKIRNPPMWFVNNFATLEKKIDHELQPIFTSKKIVDDLRETELKPPIVNQQSVVYEFKCDLCDKNYIRYTLRHLHQRVEEHKHSVIGKHLKDEHNVRPSNLRENFTILNKCRSRLECLIFEMLYIRKKRPKLNTQADSIRAKLFV